ncbi:hypothetical protein [Paenibacillus sp. sgz500992]|uniref:hypothetical protein n=1 Tax=Paenibacillus sp. sgz500992 TaxID=3242476 RepID=UPI0036D22466
MKKELREIVTDEQFSCCFLSKVRVLLCCGDDHNNADESVIVGFNTDIIKAANGSYYARGACRVLTSENYFRLAHPQKK